MPVETTSTSLVPGIKVDTSAPTHYRHVDAMHDLSDVRALVDARLLDELKKECERLRECFAMVLMEEYGLSRESAESDIAEHLREYDEEAK